MSTLAMADCSGNSANDLPRHPHPPANQVGRTPGVDSRGAQLDGPAYIALWSRQAGEDLLGLKANGPSCPQTDATNSSSRPLAGREPVSAIVRPQRPQEFSGQSPCPLAGTSRGRENGVGSPVTPSFPWS